MIAQQTSVRLANGWNAADEATRRDIDLLRHCERVAKDHGVTLAAAIDEWASARKAVGEIPISDAVRFYQANRKDLLIRRTLAQVAEEFIESRRANGSSEIHVRNCKDYLGRLTGQVKADIADVTTADLNEFLRNQKTLGPVSRNSLRGTIVSMFRFAKRQAYPSGKRPSRRTPNARWARFLPWQCIPFGRPRFFRSSSPSTPIPATPETAVGGSSNGWFRRPLLRAGSARRASPVRLPLAPPSPRTSARLGMWLQRAGT